MEPLVRAAAEPASAQVTSGGPGDALERYDHNRDGCIKCAEARRHGIAPTYREHPAYKHTRAADSDGAVCE